MNTSNIFERLKEERLRLGLNQAQAGDLCGVQRETWSRYESGKLSPGMEVLAAIAAAGADVQYILTGLRAVPSVETLSPRKKALLDNYENTDDRGREAIEQLASAQAEYQPTKKRAKGGE